MSALQVENTQLATLVGVFSQWLPTGRKALWCQIAGATTQIPTTN
jgi:hypothetical protein